MANLIPYDPFSETGFDDLFRGFFQPMRLEGRNQPLSVKMDVAEEDKSYIVHAEIPGVNIRASGSAWRGSLPRCCRGRSSRARKRRRSAATCPP